MGKILKINASIYQYLIVNGKLYGYKLHSGRIVDSFNIKKLLFNSSYYKSTLENGFKYYEKDFWNKNDERKTFYIPLSKEFIEYYILHWKENFDNEGYLPLYNISLDSSAILLYEFSIEVEISGLRSKFTESLIDNFHIYIERPYNNEELEKKMTAILGSPQIPADIGHDKYGSHYYYIVPTDKLDKIIGIKRYRDTSTFGKADGEKFTGEVEEIILDLHNFDENIYEIFKEHGMVEIEE